MMPGKWSFPIGEMLGEGSSAEVYAMEDNRVLKAFRGHVTREHVEREFQNTEKVREAGLPVPQAHELVEADGQLGIVFQRMAGRALQKFIMERPCEIDETGRRFARLHYQIHQPIDAQLPWQVTKYMDKIRESQALPFALQRQAMRLLGTLPLGNSLCHGDFTPPNVVVNDQTIAVLDWPNAVAGNPVACVVETSLNLVRYRENVSEPFLYGAEIFRKSYLEECARLRPSFAEDFAQWEPVVAAAMLSTTIYEPEIARLRGIVVAGLERLGRN